MARAVMKYSKHTLLVADDGRLMHGWRASLGTGSVLLQCVVCSAATCLMAFSSFVCDYV